MRIGTIAKKAGVGVETIRFYERKGLISQPLKPKFGGFRSYTDETAQRVRFIRQAQALGFSLAETMDLLSLEADPDTDCAAVRDRAQIKLGEVKQKIAGLVAIETSLKKIIGTCPGSGRASEACSILSTLRSDPGTDGAEPATSPSK